MAESKVVKIVITGAPGSGKTEFFERLKTEAALSEFVFLEELARKILSDEPEIRHDLAALHKRIYSRQVSREEAAGGRSLITDRGTVDAFAFHPESMVHAGTTLEREYRRYSAIIQLGSAASLGEPYYRQDNIRTESIAEALEIEQAIKNVWFRHPEYIFLPADKNLDNKYDQFRKLVMQHLTG